MPRPATERSNRRPENSGAGARTGVRLGTRLERSLFDGGDGSLLAKRRAAASQRLEEVEDRPAEVPHGPSQLARELAGRPQGTATEAPPSRRAPRCLLENTGTRQLDQLVRNGEAFDAGPRGPALAEQLDRRGLSRYDAREFSAAVDECESAVSNVESALVRLAEHHDFDREVLTGVAEEATTLLVRDADLFAALSTTPTGTDYPARHGYHTSMVSMSIGTVLGLDRRTLRDLAIGCLVHDAGMIATEERCFESTTTLTPVEYHEITKHPVRLFEMLGSLGTLPKRAALVAFQMHERCDGSGYPRRRTRSKIHSLAKIAGLADAFVALVAPRPHREGMQPYHAVRHLLHETRAGKFEPAVVRALLEAVSLFPTGSHVELDDGRVGRTIRSNGAAYDRPLIELSASGTREVEILDLAADVDRRVVRVLTAEDAAAREIAPIAGESSRSC